MPSSRGSDDSYAAEFVATGTHKGPHAEVPPVRSQIQTWMKTFGRVDANGEVVEERRYFDLASLIAQLTAPA